VVALAAILLAFQLLPEGEERDIAWQDLSAEVGPLSITGTERRVFRERGRLARYLRQAQAEGTVPAIDFSSRQVLLVSPGPRSSTGYDVEILSVRERDGEITVRVREQAPTLGEDVEPRVTYPYRLLSLPAGNDVFVDWIGR
jgi:hypothetical protein